MQRLSSRNAVQVAFAATVTALVLFGSTASAINFQLAPNTRRCFVEEIPGGTDFKVTYACQPGYGQFTDVGVFDPSGTTILSRAAENKGTHSFHTQKGGDYTLCFSCRAANVAKTAEKTTVAFTFKVGSEGVDYTSLATKAKLKPMEVQLRVMEDTVRSIHGEYVYYKEKEAEMRATNEHMTAKVVWMAVLVIAIFIVFSYLQLRHLKSYFRKKRMID